MGRGSVGRLELMGRVGFDEEGPEGVEDRSAGKVRGGRRFVEAVELEVGVAEEVVGAPDVEGDDPEELGAGDDWPEGLLSGLAVDVRELKGSDKVGSVIGAEVSGTSGSPESSRKWAGVGTKTREAVAAASRVKLGINRDAPPTIALNYPLSRCEFRTR